MHSPRLLSNLHQVHGIPVLTRELGHSVLGAPGDGLVAVPAEGKLPHHGWS